MSAVPPVPAVARFASIPYWRQSKWNAAKCVPIFLLLEHGQLSAYSRENAGIFSVPVTSVQASLSKLGTMTLRVGGTSYDLVGRGNPASSPASTPEQIDTLRRFWLSAPPQPGGPTLEQAAGTGQLKVWADVLRGYGVNV